MSPKVSRPSYSSAKTPEFPLETDVDSSVMNDVSRLRENSRGCEKQKKRDRGVSVICVDPEVFVIFRAKYRGSFSRISSFF